MVTRRQIDAARPESVLAMMRSWKQSAAGSVTNADAYQASVRNPGGQSWSGQTASAAIAMADNDKKAIDNLRQAVDTMADTATNSMNNPVIPNLNDVRAKITAAEAAGFTVNDHLSVTYPASSPPDPQRQEEAERRAIEIQSAATKWWNSDQAVANQITTDKAGLALELDPGEDNFGRYERMLREAGLLTGGSPQGYYAEWLKNAERQGVSPQTLVDIARRFDIRPDDFEILERMQQITDPDGKSFFLMPDDFSGDDARRAVLMTYILNAGTDYGDAGRKRGVTNDFPETPYSADEVQRIIDRQDDNDWSYDDDVGFVHGNGGSLVATPNGMMMGLGGNELQDLYSTSGGTAWGDIFMVNIDDPADADQQLRDIVESGRAWYSGDDGAAYAGSLDLDRLLHHEERHSQQWAEKGYAEMLAAYGAGWVEEQFTGTHPLEEDAGLSDGGYR